ncbi:MAG: helix-turn-helix domain-containing protein [Anaerolineaceae bacterium]|nr:helix-turn-helix domain-containing protein [Anaerolineaceae bacterium]
MAHHRRMFTLDSFVVTQAEIGQRIQQARERIGMSQRDFAEAVGKDQTAVSLYESGKRKVAATELSTFADVLEVPVSYFYEGKIEPDDLDHILLSEFRKLPNLEAKQMILQMVRALSSLFKQHASDQ